MTTTSISKQFIAAIAVCSAVLVSGADVRAQVAAPASPGPAVGTPVRTPESSDGSTSQAPVRRGPYKEGTSLTKEIHWVRDSAEYQASAIQTFKWATRLIEEKAEKETSGTWAVVVDADEAVIDNSQFQKEIAPDEFTPAKWNDWVKREEATAITGAKAFLDRVKALGGKVAVVTNRRVSEQAHTENVFRKNGLPFDIMLCQDKDRYKDGRYDSIEKGTAAPGIGPLKTLMYVGDNIQDFPRMRQDARFKPEESLKEFGDRFIMIPNPMYGSWVNNPER